MVRWYEDKKNVIELAELIVESGQIESAKELLEYFKHPERYTEVWKIYQEEILGKITSDSTCKLRKVPELVALVHPSSQCAP